MKSNAIGKTVGSIRRTVDAVPGGSCAVTWLIAALGDVLIGRLQPKDG